ncbi:MAG: sigma-70 family RNA polymerase sigma factor [Planctomycetes bacterium]|nr:sigma-70 family RNA polymerase sigma factor [Planctomycetota bacterium]
MIARCRDGDREAQHALYDQTVTRIHHLLLKMTGNAEDAFDIAQNTYIKAFTAIEQFDGRSNIDTWLYRIAVNEALQFFRRGKREQRKREQLAGTVAQSPETPDSGSDERSTMKMDVVAALAELDPDDRAILLLRYQEGLDYSALEEVLDCPAGTIASRLNRARRRIREKLEKDYGNDEETVGTRHQNIGKSSGTS